MLNSPMYRIVFSYVQVSSRTRVGSTSTMLDSQGVLVLTFVGYICSNQRRRTRLLRI